MSLLRRMGVASFDAHAEPDMQRTAGWHPGGGLSTLAGQAVCCETEMGHREEDR